MDLHHKLVRLARNDPRVAAIVSIVETCRRLKIPVPDYLGSVLPGLSDFPINRIAELTPSAWPASEELKTVNRGIRREPGRLAAMYSPEKPPAFEVS